MGEKLKVKKIAIIGASYLQEPLIQKAKLRGIETHVFAWKVGDVGEKSADFFYPISIVEKESILNKCQEIGVDGICSIASDLASITVNYVAEHMGLIGNTAYCTEVSTNKHKMRECFEKHGDSSPRSIQVESVLDLRGMELEFPVIVKPIDRSGSRGITKVENLEELDQAIEYAKKQGFDKHALVEEYAMGQEYSVEFISWMGQHHFLALTQKYTTGAPDFIEMGHMEPADVDFDMLQTIKKVVTHALDSLEIQYGASHTELKIDKNGNIKIIEIGGRMGGDCIGSSLVELSTGFDFVGAVIDVALGIAPVVNNYKRMCAGVRFIFSNNDLFYFEKMKKENPEMLIEEDIRPISDHKVTDSSSRFGYFLFASSDKEKVLKYLPQEDVENETGN